MESTSNDPAADESGAPSHEKLSTLIDNVVEQHGDEGIESMADHLRDQVPETRARDEAPGDLED